jgi:uncharacterized protein with von Willebrand factor type A (vWA) domain
MQNETADSPAQDGKLVENLMLFARALRAAGLSVGPGKVLSAIHAVQAVGLLRRDDFYWALHAVLVNRRDQQGVFDQVFHVFWRNPDFLERMMALHLRPTASNRLETVGEPRRHGASALRAGQAGDRARGRRAEAWAAIGGALSWSDREQLNAMDFARMSAEEMAVAKKTIERFRLPIVEIPTRRFRADPAGRHADLRATMRAALRIGGDTIPLKNKRRRRRHPPLVVLCDISGSMGRYSHMLMHFLHAITSDRDRVHSFLFGTRLTNISRGLHHRDFDVALDKVAALVSDWSGGTRIGACLHEFNFAWSRRVLGQGAVVLLITDGLDRDDARDLAVEMQRLHKSCRRLIWLNPLLRYAAYEPRSLGARAMMPHVDELRPLHSLTSLAQLRDVLSRPIDRRQDGLI